MRTQVLPITAQSLALAAGLIRSGQLVAFPTETVYGLGANALDARAVGRIFSAKGRPGDNPLIVHIAQTNQAANFCRWTARAQLLADAFWPGPLTLVLPKLEVIPGVVSAGLTTVGIRLPAHEGARMFLEACGLPIAAPSANRSSHPSPTTARHVLDDLNGRIPLILDGGSAPVGLESTVLDIVPEDACVLRPGAVTPEQIAMVLGKCDVAPSMMRPLRDNEDALSPGMRHRHYAPLGKLTLVQGTPNAVAQAICRKYDENPSSRIMAMHQHLPLYGPRPVSDLGPDAHSAAHRLFYLLRQFDREGTAPIYSECLPPPGAGAGCNEPPGARGGL